MFISLMTEQTEATEIKMNMRNINIITARSVPDKSVWDPRYRQVSLRFFGGYAAYRSPDERYRFLEMEYGVQLRVFV